MKKKSLVIVGVIFFVICGVFAGVWYSSNLSGGSFIDTLYNTTGNYVYLNYTDSTNSSYVVNGTYTSQIIDFGEVTTGFTAIKWAGKGTCPQNMSYIDKFGGYCIDQYEAYSVSASVAGSAPGKTPWVSVSQTNARTYCANAGKFLCSSLMWLGAANIQGKVYNLPGDLIVAPYYCNTGSSAAYLTGNNSGCVSAEGVYDMVGNVWEWVNETVGTIKTCNPASVGYCYPNSTGGWSTGTGTQTHLYGDDGVYFQAYNYSGRAVERGGGWNYGAVAGPFAVDLRFAPGDALAYIGFRCCSSPL